MQVDDPGELVRSLRARAGLSQQGLAQRAGMAQSAISDYERGRKQPSLATLRRLAEACDLRLEVNYAAPAAAAVTVTVAGLRRRRAAIVEVCRRHGASRPRVFGSVAAGSARPDSDIDLIVDIEPGRTLFDVAALHDDLVELLGHEVDVLTSGALHGRLAHLDELAVAL